VTVQQTQAFQAALEAVERILNIGGDADDVLRQVVEVVQSRVPGYGWVGISFVDEGSLLLGPWAGEERAPDAPPPLRLPIRFQGVTVAELGVAGTAPIGDGEEEQRFLEQVAVLVSAHCLVGWDTGGVPWDEL
jgi:hypothetical protein